jgi:hypothetical protein
MLCRRPLAETYPHSGRAEPVEEHGALIPVFEPAKKSPLIPADAGTNGQEQLPPLWISFRGKCGHVGSYSMLNFCSRITFTHFWVSDLMSAAKLSGEPFIGASI